MLGGRIPVTAAQAMIATGLLACLYGAATPLINARAEAGARIELAESERFIDLQVEEFARKNELSINHSLEVKAAREHLEADVGIAMLRREAAKRQGAGNPTAASLALIFAGLAALTLGALFMAYRSCGVARVAYVLLVVIGLLVGGVGLHAPEAIAVPDPDVETGGATTVHKSPTRVSDSSATDSANRGARSWASARKTWWKRSRPPRKSDASCARRRSTTWASA